MTARQTRRRRRSNPLFWLAIALVVLIVALVWSFRIQRPQTPGTRTSLDAVEALARDKQVAEATVYDRDARIAVVTKAGATLWAAYPSGGAGPTGLASQMSASGATVTVDQQWNKQAAEALSQFILPLLLLADLFGIVIFLTRGGSGQVKELFAFSGMKAKRVPAGAGASGFEQVAALDEAVAELAEVRDYLKDPARFAAMGALPPKGVLLFGPPGCGKTLLAKALAGEAGVPFYFISGSEFVESLVGVGAARVRDLFRQAKEAAPAIIFVDELDAAGRRRGAGVGGGHDEREQTLNQLLVEMDGFAPSLGVVLIGATNRPDILDPALLRPGRFDRHVVIEPPDVRGRLDILNLHAATRPLAADADLRAVAQATPGFTGADLANVLNESVLLALRRRSGTVSADDLAEAVQRVQSGPKRRGRLLTATELERLAYHEAGHAIVASSLPFPSSVQRVSITSRGRQAASCTVPKADRVLLTRTELLAEIAISVAGVAAEQLRTGESSTASEGDIERATDLARQFVGRYGMSEAVGPIRVLRADREVFLGRDFMNTHDVSESTMREVDEDVRGVVAAGLDRALTLLQHSRAALDELAGVVAEAETVDGAVLAGFLEDARSAIEQAAAARPAARRAKTSRSTA